MSDDAQALHVETRTVNSQPVVTICGDVDLRSAPQLRRQLLSAPRTGDGSLLVDLSGVEYMDSSGVGTLVYVKREVEDRKGKVILIGLQPRVRSVLEITRLDKFFNIVDSTDEVAGK